MVNPLRENNVLMPLELAALFESSPMAAIGIALMDEQRFVDAALRAKHILAARALKAQIQVQLPPL